MKYLRTIGVSAAVSALTVITVSASGILSPTDTVYSIHTGYSGPSSYPEGEAPGMLLDGNPATKYLNFAGKWSGFIVTPGASTLQSIQFTTANDADGRDPAYVVVYGTTDAIGSTANSRGRGETWTQIYHGAISLPTTRGDSSTFLNIPNSSSYTSYKVLFPKTRGYNDPNMQLADVQFYTGSSGSGSSLLTSSTPIVGVDDNGANNLGSQWAYPAAESPGKILDGSTGTKFLNFGGAGTGFIVVPGIGASIVKGMEIWTGNDSEPRDPSSFEIWGLNGSVSYGDNSNGDIDAGWTLIDSGALSLTADRETSSGMILLDNADAYDAYKVIFPTLKGGPYFQISDFQLYEVVPEPSALALVGLATGLLVLRRRQA